jgi:RNA polymerase sigma-70 factor (ECF subfamily)
LAATEAARFEAVVLPHLDSAYRLARHLMRNEHDAEDAVHEGCMRALRYFEGFRGDNARAWLLAIVRHACFARLRRPWMRAFHEEFDEVLHSPPVGREDPLATLEREESKVRVRAAVEELPLKYREVIVLREIEGLSYKEIGAILRAPIGTVMSRLARARGRLQQTLDPHAEEAG